MANYTTQLRTIIESGYHLTSLDQYPVYDENFRPVLNKMILDKYWFREIGLETPEMFNWFLRVKLGEIMPYYNKMYQSELIVIDPLENYRNSKTSKRTIAADGSTATGSNQTVTVDQTQNDVNKQVFSDTPQGAIDIDLDAGTYATTLTKDENERKQIGSNGTVVSATGTQNQETIDDYVETVAGFNNQNQADALNKYRSTFMMVTKMLLAELNDLFMGVW
jgi:hypothetical protein